MRPGDWVTYQTVFSLEGSFLGSCCQQRQKADFESSWIITSIGTIGSSMQGLDDRPSEDNRWIATRRCPSVPSSKDMDEENSQMAVPILPIAPSTSSWPTQPQLGLHSTKPRSVTSPPAHDSSKRSLPTSISEMNLPPSNSDLLVGSLNQRDQYTMSSRLNNPVETELPPPPPQVSSGRLGAIIVV